MNLGNLAKRQHRLRTTNQINSIKYSKCLTRNNINKMEKSVDKVLEDLMDAEGVTGCIVSDKQGLCLGSRGIASPESSGILTAMSEYAKKLHSSEPAPTIVLQNNDKQCIVQSNEKLVVSLYKKLVA